MTKPFSLLAILFCLAGTPNYAQNTLPAIDSLLIGIWTGSSICQVKNSPCHDEQVVYHISKNKGIDTFFINAGKIVNGVEEQMGIIPFVYHTKTNQLISTAYGVWTFTISGHTMEGTLIARGELFRKIKVVKQE